MTRIRITIAGALVCAAALAPLAAAPPEAEDTAIIHVLNRIGFGPRAGDVARVRQIGLQKYIDRQLHPERIADSSLQERLAGFVTLSMSTREIAERFAQPRLDARRANRQRAASAGSDKATPEVMRPQERQQANLPMLELAQQKVIRATYSERQLQEVLTDFWFNHFNVDARKGPVRFLLTEYEREAIRPHVLGRFRELLGATAKSPAMLFYLDNWMSASADANPESKRMGPSGATRPGRVNRTGPPAAPQRPAARRGLNENYARELMELHTIGVDGGYTQRDVTEVARALTGWTIDQPRAGGGFRFAARLHDDGEKTIVGQKIPAGGGERDGERVLDILAAHPATARFISTKLAARFVSDRPPAALVDRLAGTFTATRGDLRAVMSELLTSPEFLAPASYRAKVKTPFEYVVSALRATDASVADARSIVRSLQTLGMPLYQCQPPTGYKDTAESWVGSGALVNRMNFALALASGQLQSVTIGGPLEAGPILMNGLSDTTRSTVAKAATPQQAMALALGSPEFQRR